MTDTDFWPPVLTIAGSDSGGGAGIQADLKTFTWFKTFGTTAVTVVTAQNPHRVQDVQPLPPGVIAAQVETVFEAFPIKAVKTGMLFNSEIIETIAELVKRLQIKHLTVDPVMVAGSGAALLRKNAVAALTQKLLPLAETITPNLPEAEILLNRQIDSRKESECISAARELSRRFNSAVILKGGHDKGEYCHDYLYSQDQCHRFTLPRCDTLTSHGTGCMFSAAATACLAREMTIFEAVKNAKEFVHSALNSCLDFGGQTAAMKISPELALTEADILRI